MPYRRLPNTDQARLRSLKRAIQRSSEAEFGQNPLTFKTRTEAEHMLSQFETLVSQFQDNYDTRVEANRQYRRLLRNARIYVSHFIQVLDMAVTRGEIKREYKEFYGLDPAAHGAPALSSADDVIYWGKKIIEGEMHRQSIGGQPMTNPGINKVKVHYDILIENTPQHSFQVHNTSRVYGDLEQLRLQADALILDIWNQVEEFYRDDLPYAKMCHAKEYGVIYYYRPGEKKLTAESDRELERIAAMQPTLFESE